MTQKTRGIVLKVTKYAENSVISQIFTEDFGLQSYLVTGARKPKAKIPMNILQPLHILDMVVYNKTSRTLQHIKEAHQTPIFQDLPTNIVKSSIALFLNEVLYKVLKHQNADKELFYFIFQSILWLDQSKSTLSNFHLCFLMKLSKFLGYLPTVSSQKKPFFDLAEGVFSNSLPAHKYILQEPHTSIMYAILSSNYAESHKIQVRHEDRIYMLEQIINFYKLHTNNFGNINSLEILEEIFH